MSALFQELDYRLTPLGALSLRRRANLFAVEDVYEIILNGEYLMSSRFTAAEEALAVIGLELGYTARSALANDRVGSLVVVDSLPEILEWHLTGLLPLGPR